MITPRHIAYVKTLNILGGNDCGPVKGTRIGQDYLNC